MSFLKKLFRQSSKVIDLSDLKFEDYFIDIPLTISSVKENEDHFTYLAVGSLKNEQLSITIKLKKNIGAGFKNGEPVNVFIKDGISFKSNGNESDKLLKLIAKHYEINEENLILKDEQVFTCANLNQSIVNYQKGIAKFKVFLESESEYAELYVNFDFKNKVIWLNEKDEGYRIPLINLLKKIDS